MEIWNDESGEQNISIGIRNRIVVIRVCEHIFVYQRIPNDRGKSKARRPNYGPKAPISISTDE